MLIVADTSPLNYLVLIDAIKVLPKLYGRIIIPRQVHDELRDADSHEQLRAWLAMKPDWLEVRFAKPIESGHLLDEGEAAAISLAQELRADRLLIDERDGRAFAMQAGIPIAGTLAVLSDAASEGLIDFKAAIEKLKRTTFRASPRLYTQVLADVEKTRRK